MARLPDIERRLLNWARWKIGCTSGGLGFASVVMEDRVDGEGFDAQAKVPTIDHEAAETDVAVLALDGRLRASVESVYVASGTMRRKAARLCCAEATIYARIDEAHRVLARWFSEKAAVGRAERERVERLQRAAVRR
ncbi:hypothetical protein [Methylibium sp.]|uniref:hypothetical protein n=1 Tax=Methylibium sp. TaxID=2067992 RepID=UPI003D103832